VDSCAKGRAHQSRGCAALRVELALAGLRIPLNKELGLLVARSALGRCCVLDEAAKNHSRAERFDDTRSDEADISKDTPKSHRNRDRNSFVVLRLFRPMNYLTDIGLLMEHIRFV
jgi:hypothetical protein